MQELRLVGVQQDGRHLLLAGSDGTRYRLAISDDLRVAARHRSGSTPGSAQLEPMSARDLQALIRSGFSAVEAAERSGWTLSKVEVFAAPVLAEREHIAGMAARTRLRSATGSVSERLESRVHRRLAGRGVTADSMAWDAGRGASGNWQVFCDFVAGGRQRRAVWSFEPRTGELHPQEDEARWLTGDDDPDAKPQPHRLTDERVFDVEADGGLAGPDDSAGPLVTTVDAARVDQTDALMTAIRAHSHAGERRGRRRRASPGPVLAAETLGGDTDPLRGDTGVTSIPLAGADELTFADLEVSPAAATASPAAVDAEAPEAGAQEAAAPATEGAGSTDPVNFPESDEMPPPARGTHPLDLAREAETAPVAPQPSDPEPQESAPQESAPQVPTPPGSSRRKGRVGVPNWNDVMFGPAKDAQD